VGRLDDTPIKKDNPPAPDRVLPGVVVEHDTFGRGVVRRVGLYRRLHTIWVQFDSVGDKALMPLHAMPHMRMLTDPARRPDSN
jgi:hypothetical protein